MVNPYKQTLTQLQQEILRLFFIKAGISLNHRQIANYLQVSAPAVRKALPALEDMALIKCVQDKETKRWSIELNRDYYKVMQLKRADNLRLLYEIGLVDFLEHTLAGATIILFGSYSRGEDTIKSDIDLAIIGRNEKPIDFSAYEKKLERNITLNYYEGFNKIHKSLRENLFNGIILCGAIEL